MANRYFTLANSTNTLIKRFRVLQSGYNPVIEKKGSVKTTLDGKWDISQGGIYTRHEYIIKVRFEEDDINFGTKDELLIFFKYNQPNPPPGTPSNRLTLTDHFGASWLVATQGETSPIPLGCMIDGIFAWYNMKLMFIFLQSLDGGPS